MGNIYDEANSFAELFANDLTIEFCKSNENLWENNKIEITTSLMPPYLSFKIETDDERKDGDIQEIWYWSEDYEPVPITYPVLQEWQEKQVSISFEEKDDEYGGKDGEISKIF